MKNKSIKIRYDDLAFSAVIGVSLGINHFIPTYLLNFIFSTIVYIWVARTAEEKSSIHILTLVGYSVFIFVAALLNGYLFNTPFDLFYTTSFLVFILLRATSGIVDKSFYDNKSLFLAIFICYSVALIYFSFYTFYFDYSYILAPYVMFFALALKVGGHARNFLILLIFLTAFAVFFAYGWSGYARTVTMGNLIVAVLCFLRIYDISPNKYLISAVSVLGAMLMTARKGFDLEAARSMEFLNDSAFNPYRLAADFIQFFYSRGSDLGGFMEQVVFTFLSFVPREIWEQKPLAFGAVYVLENMDQYLTDSGHSIASTLFGDHVYYLGWWGFGSAVVMILLFSKLIRYIYRWKLLDGALYIIISCNMMVLIWGGMTSFSARLIYPLIGVFPILIIYSFFNRVKTMIIRQR